ncbi:MAG: Rieske (2Fe-2S) protein [Hyphomicrobiales bacterium]|nr:MAG: Rieske (2Fe-2S) protein [Hyphomicrobiales bacterium]
MSDRNSAPHGRGGKLPTEARLQQWESVESVDYPVAIAHSSELMKPRDYVTDDVTGIPVLAVRQQDGSLKAFLNVCRHRGVQVVTECAGNRRSFTCPYHGWTYAPDGGLRGIPYRQAFGNIDRAERGLREVPVEERHGLIWIRLTPESSLDVSSYLTAALDRDLTALQSGDLVVERKQTFDASSDWLTVANAVYNSQVVGAGASAERHSGSHEWVLSKKSGSLESQRPPDMAGWAFPHNLFARQGDHVELWGIYPARSNPMAATVRLTLLAPKDRRENTLEWDQIWARLLDRYPGLVARDSETETEIEQGSPAEVSEDHASL